MTWFSFDLFNLFQIAGIVLALMLACALETFNKKLHLENQSRDDVELLDTLEFKEQSDCEANIATHPQLESKHAR